MEKLTRETIVEILGQGRLDDHNIIEIIDTGGTPDDLLEAFNRVVRGGAVGEETQRPAGPVVSALCEILANAEEDWSEDKE